MRRTGQEHLEVVGQLSCGALTGGQFDEQRGLGHAVNDVPGTDYLIWEGH